MLLDAEPDEFNEDFAEDDPPMTEGEFDAELALAAQGKWDELGLDGGVIPGFEKTPIAEFMDDPSR